MSATSGQARRPIRVFVSAAWLAPALLAVLKEYARGLIGGGPAADPRPAAFEGGDWLPYSFLTPLVFLLARRFPLEKGAAPPTAAPCRRGHPALRRLESAAAGRVYLGPGAPLRRAGRDHSDPVSPGRVAADLKARHSAWWLRYA